MPRAKNLVDAVQITVSITPTVRDYLQELTVKGLHGKNVAETANDLLGEKIREMIKTGELKPPSEKDTNFPNETTNLEM